VESKVQRGARAKHPGRQRIDFVEKRHEGAADARLKSCSKTRKYSTQ
jgi:hypothetical protein